MMQNKTQLNTYGLDSRDFEAFSETSQRSYFFMCNMSTDVSRWSRNAVKYFGLPGEYMEHAGQIWEEHVHPEDRALYHHDIEQLFTGKKTRHVMNYRAKNKLGEYVLCTCHGIIIKGKNGEPDLFTGTIDNQGIVKNIDATTHLFNLDEFMHSLKNMVDSKENGSILHIGIQHFSNINSVYGYNFGNKVLESFASKLKELIHKKGKVYRIWGPKFAFSMTYDNEEEVRELYEKIENIAAKGLTIGDNRIVLNISGGAMIYNGEDMSEFSVFTAVNSAFETSKRVKQGELEFVNYEEQETGKRTLTLLDDLKKAIHEDCKGFYIQYQPIINPTTHQIVEMEALLRFNQQPYGEVPPGKFIPWLENDPSFYSLGNWILEKAVQDCLKLVKAYPDFVLNVNVSFSQLEKTSFRKTVIDILKRNNFPFKNLCLEITERCRALNWDYLKEEIQFFREQGIKIALDDFGTGLSSLSLIKEFSVDCIKIDQTFVRDILESNVSRAIVDSTLVCAKQLGIACCIEGIENKEIADYFSKYTFCLHQGYYYDRPLFLDQIYDKLGLSIKN